MINRTGSVNDNLNYVKMIVARYKDVVIKAALLVGLLVAVLGSLYKPVGDWLENIRFAGPALLLGVAFLVLDAMTSERRSSSPEQAIVLSRPSRLQPYVAELFDQDDVSIDFAGYIGETLWDSLGEFLDDLAAGRRKVRSLRVTIQVRLAACRPQGASIECAGGQCQQPDRQDR